MKKIILGIVFVFVTSIVVNANTYKDEYDQDCLQRAWDYGTENGGGDSYMEWHYMSVYMDMNFDCAPIDQV
ncbi:hypothetical protein [Lutibacter sp.]|uniref:hypothetical protein n=1 Tax=Lutibacter sp. TaxID=1925666 RepID=UPI0034A0A5D7